MLKSKKIVIIMLILFLLVSLSTQVRASSDNPVDLPILSGNETDENAITANEIAANQIAANEAATNSQVIQPTTNTAGSSYSNNSLPQTGVTEDITVMFFIIVCVISAIYAYKKIRDYNM